MLPIPNSNFSFCITQSSNPRAHFKPYRNDYATQYKVGRDMGLTFAKTRPQEATKYSERMKCEEVWFIAIRCFLNGYGRILKSSLFLVNPCFIFVTQSLLVQFHICNGTVFNCIHKRCPLWHCLVPIYYLESSCGIKFWVLEMFVYTFLNRYFDTADLI